MNFELIVTNLGLGDDLDALITRKVLVNGVYDLLFLFPGNGNDTKWILGPSHNRLIITVGGF